MNDINALIGLDTSKKPEAPAPVVQVDHDPIVQFNAKVPSSLRMEALIKAKRSKMTLNEVTIKLLQGYVTGRITI